MIIAICTSMVFTDRMLEAKKALESRGHKVYVSEFADAYVGKGLEESERLAIVHKKENDAIRVHWEKIKKSDAILVLNYDKRGVKNYVGGNTLMEMGFAFVLNKRIFMLNPAPEIPYYKSEIEAMRPVILNGDLGKIR